MNKEEFNYHINDIPIPEDRLIQREKQPFFKLRRINTVEQKQSSILVLLLVEYVFLS